jgi:hypothetical protein
VSLRGLAGLRTGGYIMLQLTRRRIIAMIFPKDGCFITLLPQN